MSNKDGSQEKNGKNKEIKTVGDRRREEVEVSNKRRYRNFMSLVVLIILIGVSFGVYMNFIWKAYPYSDPAVLELGGGANESVVVVHFVNELTNKNEKDVYTRITNPITQESWEYYTNEEGKVWILAQNTTVLNFYVSKDDYHSELFRLQTGGGAVEIENAIHTMKPYEYTRFIVQVANETHTLSGVEVYFKGKNAPVYTDQNGAVFMDVTELTTIEYLIVPPEGYGESYESSYTIDDYWVFEKVTVFFDKLEPPTTPT